MIPVMIVAVCSVLIVKGSSVLLVKEQKDIAKDKYGLPGGKLEQGEQLRDCAIRECKEETGLDVTLDKLVMVSMKPRTHEGNTVLRYMFQGTVSGAASDGELHYGYFTKAQVQQLAQEDRIRGQDVVALLERALDQDLPAIPEPEVF